MVVQARPYPRQIENELYADFTQVLGRANAGEHQQLRRADCARGEYDLSGAECCG